MKKKIHHEYVYEIPDNSGTQLIENKGFSYFMYIHENELNNPELHSFLLKILAALHLENTKNLSIISCKDDFVYPIHSLLGNKDLSFVSFGIRPSQMQLQGFDQNHTLYHYQGCCLLFANSLKSYMDEPSKKILWSLLKKMFNI